MAHDCRPLNSLPSSTRPHRLARNTLWNLLGGLLPLLAYLVALPWLVHRLGDPSFGVLSQVLLLLGLAGVLDLGTGMALTKLLAEQPAGAGHERSAALIGSALSLIALLGAAAAGLLLLLSPVLVYHVLAIPEALRHDALWAFVLAALAIPAVLLAAACRGILEARQRFGLTNLVRVAAPLLILGGQVGMAVLTPRVLPQVIVCVAAIFATAAGFALICWHALPEWRGGFRLRRDAVRPIVQLGGWMSFTSIVGTPMLYGDRYLIGALLGAAAVTYYAIPFDLITKLWLLPTALAGVLLPALAAANHDRAAAGRLFRKSVKHTFLLVFPAALTVCAFAPEGLALWQGAEFAAQSSRVLQVLCAGVLVSGISVLPLTALQSAGRPDLSAKLYLVEAPCYVAVTLWAIHAYGLAGAAAAWTARLTLEALALLLLARRVLNLPARAVWQPAAALSGGLALLMLVATPAGLGVRAAAFAAIMVAYVLAAWRLALDDREKALLRRWRSLRLAALQEVRP